VRESLEAIRVLKPDIVVMDIRMPDGLGLEAAARALAELPGLKVLFLSMLREEEYVLEALRVGAAGYLLKEAATAELGLAFEAMDRGELYLSPGVSAPVARSAIASAGGAGDVAERLTPRQIEILRLIAGGRSTKEIAYDLKLSVKTIETHRAALMMRLGIHDVAGLVRYAIRVGLVRVDD
jgi:DNA-binding NarL/FixJ family response regulator